MQTIEERPIVMEWNSYGIYEITVCVSVIQ